MEIRTVLVGLADRLSHGPVVKHLLPGWLKDDICDACDLLLGMTPSEVGNPSRRARLLAGV